MFGFKNEDKEKAEAEYNELLEKMGKNKNKQKVEGFVLGEQKTIYSSGMSLDDIISQNDK